MSTLRIFGHVLCLVSIIAIYLITNANCTHGGLGEQLIWENNISDSMESEDQIFIRSKEGNLDEERVKSLMKLIEIELVAPNKQLRDMMRLVCTKTGALFLKDYDRYYRDLQVGSSSRPMLISFLGLELTEPSLIRSWYLEQREPNRLKMIRSCGELLQVHKRVINGAGLGEEIRDLLSSWPRDSRPYLALLMQRNNINLFMLENYLLLCDKLEPEKWTSKEKQNSFLAW